MTDLATNLLRVDPRQPDRATIDRAAAIVRDGGLVAFPTETVYGLGANALVPTALRKIFAAKDRPHWDPLIVHVTGVAMAEQLALRLPQHFALLTEKFWPGPLTLVVEKSPRVPDEATAGRASVALRRPAHPVAAALLAAAQLPIAAPSANRFGCPSPTRAAHVSADLGDRVDLILDAGPTPLGVESTILDLTQTPPAILRPGGVTREQLEALLGPVALAPGVAEQLAQTGLRAPGMTLKHYAPRAAVEIFEDEPRLLARSAELQQAGRRFGIIATAAAAEMAPRLYDDLRALDAEDVEVILCALPPAEGLGLAVRDRLQRAAGLGGTR